MKKLVLSVVAMVLSVSLVNAQDLATATETYNNGAIALNNGDKAGALDLFNQALAMALSLGEEGNDIAANCKTHIPSIQFSIAKEAVNDARYDDAVAELNKTVETANLFGDEATAFDAAAIIPQVLMQKANSFFNDKNFAEAAAAYASVLDVDANNGMAALRMGAALASSGQKEAAIEAYRKAVELGQDKAANKQLSNLYLKDAAGALKAKKYDDAVKAALASNECLENAKAYQIAGQASQIQGKNNDALNYFGKYLEMAPTAANAGQIAYTMAVIYQQQKNTEKAREYYQKASTDPKYGAEAQKQLAALK